MRRQLGLPVWIAVLLIGVYAVRAVFGLWGGTAYSHGRYLAALAEFERALPLLNRADIGAERAAALWLRGQVRLGIYHERLAEGQPAEAMRDLMRQAYRDYSEAISLSPASGWYWAGLGDIYHQRERIERFRAGFPLEFVGKDPWNVVGRPGRVAVGMVRIATRREPTVRELHNQLAFILLDYRLRSAALDVVRRSAEMQPRFSLHAYKDLDPLPPEVLDAFAEGARAALGSTPFVSPAMHRIALARIELRRENFTQAEADLKASFQYPARAVIRATAHYYLGRALAGQNRFEEAREALQAAADHPSLAASSLATQAQLAEQQGNLEEALLLLQRARQLKPYHIGHAMAFARLAREVGQWERAAAALRSAAAVHRSDVGLLRELGLTYVEAGELDEARDILIELDQTAGDVPATRQLRAAIEQAKKK